MIGTSLKTGLEGWKRTHTLGELGHSNVGDTVTLMGWVHRRRDHGNLIFLDLRDRYGVTQVVLDPGHSEPAHKKGSDLRGEYVVAVRGQVRDRPAGMVNEGIPTGGIEVAVDDLKILNKAAPLPFPIHQEDNIEATESLRLKYRYLDLRRQAIRNNILGRTKFVRCMRNAMERHGFLDIETPYLYKSTPEGAREFLVPARLHPGQFYALPQSPQLFKQVLMIAGFDRYYQVVHCFRDEDLRADRQPEFTQVDCEMSFAEQEDILQIFETITRDAVGEFRGEELPAFERITYDDAMEKYGVDKPDLRFGLELNNITDLAAKGNFKVFAEAVSTGGIVNTLVVPGGADRFSRKDLEGLAEVAKKYGAKGLAWAKVSDGQGTDKWQSPIAKFFTSELLDEITRRSKANPGDVILFGAGAYDSIKASLGALRNHLGARLELYDPKELKFAWVVDFPLLERDTEGGRWMARHHPFTMPRSEDLELLETDPGRVRAAAYDLVLNGHEVAGGSIRIHDPNVQRFVFKCLGLSDEEVQQKFGFLLEALSYGAPPHGGMAYGLDRMVMCLLGTEAIRDVIPFPKTQRAACLMTDSPGKVSLEELRDLHIRVQMPLSETNRLEEKVP